MKHPCSRLVALLAVSACSLSLGEEGDEWPRRVIAAANYLTGVWDVEGTLGQERWTGQWSCRWLPAQKAYYITCSGSVAGEAPGSQRAVVLRAFEASRGRFVDRVYAAGGFRESVAGRGSGGDRPHSQPVRVERKGPDEFIWRTSVPGGSALTIVFRRAEAPGR